MSKEYKVIENGIEYDVKEYNNGDKFWFLNGELHRENGLPAVEYTDGDKFWFLNGELHRENGPACEYDNGTKFWYLNGIEYKENDIISLMNKSFIFKDGIDTIATSDFWYDLIDGGYIKPEEILTDDYKVKMVRESIKTLENFKNALMENNIIEEM